MRRASPAAPAKPPETPLCLWLALRKNPSLWRLRRKAARVEIQLGPEGRNIGREA